MFFKLILLQKFPISYLPFAKKAFIFTGSKSESDSENESSSKRQREVPTLSEVANNFLTNPSALLPDEFTRESSSDRKRIEQKSMLVQMLWLAKAKLAESHQLNSELKERLAISEANKMRLSEDKIRLTARNAALEAEIRKLRTSPNAKVSPKIVQASPTTVTPTRPTRPTPMPLMQMPTPTRPNIDPNLSIMQSDPVIVRAKKAKVTSPPATMLVQVDPAPADFNFRGQYTYRRGHKPLLRGHNKSRYDDNLFPTYGRGYAHSSRGGRRAYNHSPANRRPFPRTYATEYYAPEPQPQPIIISTTQAVAAPSAITNAAAIPLPMEPQPETPANEIVEEEEAEEEAEEIRPSTSSKAKGRRRRYNRTKPGCLDEPSSGSRPEESDEEAKEGIKKEDETSE